MAQTKEVILSIAPFKILVCAEPFSLSVNKDSKELLSLEKRDLKLKTFSKDDNSINLKFSDSSNNEINLNLKLDSNTLFVNWSSNKELEFTDDYQTTDYLYGGGFLIPQDFPFNQDLKAEQFPFGNVQLPYVFSSSGMGILVFDYKPIHVAFNFDKLNKKYQISFGRKDKIFAYQIILGNNVKDLYYKFVKIVGKPSSALSKDVFVKPIYSTWAQYKTAVDQEKVIQYAKDIIKNEFPIGILEIDDKWEVHYGDFDFDKSKFLDPKSMVNELHKLGFLVTLWVYPFINLDSKNYKYAVSEGLLVSDKNGNPVTVKWWNGEAGLLDFTNPKAYEWFKEKLKGLQENYGFDGFKFDAGDAVFFPLGSITFKQVYPAEYSDVYMSFIAENYQKLSETRVSVFAQKLGLLTRLGDKDSRWGLNNGLHSVITSTLTYSLLGYPFILPDMIGGNEYGKDKCDDELFIRWTEASIPMPSIQFSILPWRKEFSNRTTYLSKMYAWLHVKLSNYVLKLVNQSLLDGSPIIRPLFFDYEGENLFTISDEFMLGESLLFAPVIEQGKTSRDVILPRGRWLDLWENKEYEGPTKISNYDAPLYKLPIFMNLDKPLDSETSSNLKEILSKIKE